MATKRRPQCTIPDCIKPQSTKVIGPELCDEHYEYEGWVNQHSDEGHGQDDIPTDPNCPVCQAEDIPETAQVGPHTWSSHAACEHPRTPKGRAACRKERAYTRQVLIDTMGSQT